MSSSNVIEIPSELKHVRRVSQEILKSLPSSSLDTYEPLDVRLCIEEAVINAIKYGNKFNKDLEVKVGYSIEDNKLRITIEDEGEGFDYKNLPDPTLEENLQELKGRGIFLIKRLMDEAYFNDKGNCLTMVKYFKKRRPKK